MTRTLYLVIFLLLAQLVMPASAQVDSTACVGIDHTKALPDNCLALMTAFPKPTVTQIRRDGYTINTYSFWKVQHADTPVFDAPDGNVVRAIPAGFHFVSAINSSGDDWIQIQDGGWMRTSDLKYSPASEFRGVQLLDNLASPMAWALDTMFTSATPGGKQDSDNGRLIMRYDMVNLFAEVLADDGWVWYMVGPDQWIEQRVLSRPVKTERPEGVEGRWVAVDLYEQSLVAYDGDTAVFATIIASGLPGTDTNEGLFHVWADLPADRMSGAAGAPNAYDLTGVPWVQYFDGGISLHGTYWHDNFGYRRSRGCVNLSISDARWLFEWAQEGYRQDDRGRISKDNLGIAVLVWASGEYKRSGASTR